MAKDAKTIAKDGKKPVEQAKSALKEQMKQELEDLPFPRATITNMIRKNVTKGKQIKGRVKVEMNKWLGKVVEDVAKRMDNHPYTYIDHSMFQEAIEVYEKLEEISKEKVRILAYLETMRLDVEMLQREVGKKFEIELSSDKKEEDEDVDDEEEGQQ